MPCLSFHVECRTDHGEHVTIVGNHDIFGFWDPNRSQISLTTDSSQYPIWTGSCELPAGHLLEFKIVVLDGQNARWETIRNRRVSITCAIQLHMKFDILGNRRLNVAYADVTQDDITHGNASLSPCASEEMPCLSFHVECETEHGEHLTIVGNHRILGMWDPDKSQISLTADSSHYPIWRGSCELPAGHRLEFKIVARHSDRDRWESIPNRKVIVTCASMLLRMKFNTPGKTYDDIAPVEDVTILDTPNTYTPRSLHAEDVTILDSPRSLVAEDVTFFNAPKSWVAENSRTHGVSRSEFDTAVKGKSDNPKKETFGSVQKSPVIFSKYCPKTLFLNEFVKKLLGLCNYCLSECLTKRV